MSDRLWRISWVVGGAIAFVGFLIWCLASTVPRWDLVQVLQDGVTGLQTGAAAAVAGVGLAITYRTTGVFNFAFGAIAALAAYLLYQLNIAWHVPVGIAAVLVVLVFCPLLGMGLERAVFRPLQRRGASTTEKLLATIAVFALTIGLTVVIWGLGTRAKTPSLFGSRAFTFDGFVITEDRLGPLLLILASAAVVGAALRFTRLGLHIRAVVDRRTLAEMVGVRANRVAAIAWAIVCAFAGLAGALYAPVQGLSPYGVTLFILETFSVVVIARLTSMWLAVVGGLGLGFVYGMMNLIQPHLSNFWSGLQYVQPYLYVVALPLFLLIYRRLDELGSESSATGIVSQAVGQRRRRNRLVVPGAAGGGVLFLLGFVFTFNEMSTAQQILGTAVVFLSIVAITGFSGHITLGQAAFAGLGALLTTKLSNGVLPGFPRMSPIIATLVSAGLVTVLGVAAGYPALRRRGLILALTTLALNLLLYFLVFENFYFTSNGTLQTPRPRLPGVSLAGDKAFYWYELVVLALALVFTGSLRSGRLGRVLAAMRDSETGAMSVGLSLRRYKLFIFGASAFLAAIGGSILAQQSGSFDPNAWSPLISLFWFLAVVFVGLSFLSGAVLAAVLSVGLDHLAHRQDANIVVIGLLSLLTIGFLRGGVIGWLSDMMRGRGALPGGLQRRYLASAGATRAATADRLSRSTGIPVPGAPADANGQAPRYQPSPLARRLLQGSKR